eukprot:s348_g13.t1
MKCAALASFAGGLLLGGCITLVGLRGFLLRQDTLLRQSSLEKLPLLPESPTNGTAWMNADESSNLAGRPSSRPAPPRPFEPKSSPGRVPRASSPDSPGQDPSGLRKCSQRSCLGEDISAIHRSVILLATGKERLPVFHGPGFFPLYIVTADIEAQALWEVGANGLFFDLERFQDLPFTDFAADMVVLDVGSFPKDVLGGVVTEAVRILAQQGVLFVLGATEFDISQFSPQAGKLVVAGSFAHSFVRRLGVVPGLPICKACGMRSMFGERSIELSPENQCQAWVQPGFKSIFSPEIASKFSSNPKTSAENQRLIHWYRPNVVRTQQVLGEGEWVDRYSKPGGGSKKSYEKAYVNSDPFKLPPRLELLVKDGKIKRILDAGAGSCSLEGELRRKGYWKQVHNFLAFGAYDCSMLRICAERGSISFQHNWLIPLPVCAACKFDLIYQFAGVHHMPTVDEHDKFISNMLALLECNGVLFVNDRTGKKVWSVLFRQVLEVKREQKLARYVESKDGFFEISRTC